MLNLLFYVWVEFETVSRSDLPLGPKIKKVFAGNPNLDHTGEDD